MNNSFKCKSLQLKKTGAIIVGDDLLLRQLLTKILKVPLNHHPRCRSRWFLEDAARPTRVEDNYII